MSEAAVLYQDDGTIVTLTLNRPENRERLRLVHVAVEPGEVLAEAHRRAEEIAAAAPLAVRLMKKTLYAGLDWNPRRAAQVESWPQAATLTSDDAREGIAALLEKRPPIFRGR